MSTRDHDFYLGLGSRLRDARVTRGISQGHLGERVGVSFQQMQKYEKGHDRVPVDKLVTMAAALEVSVVTLLAGDAGVVALPAPAIRERNRIADAMLRLEPDVRRRVMALVDTLAPAPAPAEAAPESPAPEPLAA